MLKFNAVFTLTWSADPIEGGKQKMFYLALIILAAAGLFFGGARWMKSSDDRDEKTIKIFYAISVIGVVAAIVVSVADIQHPS